MHSHHTLVVVEGPGFHSPLRVVHQPLASERLERDFLQFSIGRLVQVGQLLSQRLLCRALTRADRFPFLLGPDVIHDGVGTPSFDNASSSHTHFSFPRWSMKTHHLPLCCLTLTAIG